MSLFGGLSAGCLGSTSKLYRTISHRVRKDEGKDKPATIQVLEISMMLRVLEDIIKVYLYFRYSFEVIGYLEALHI